MTFLLIVFAVGLIYFIMRSRDNNTNNVNGYDRGAGYSGAGSLLTGMLLGYLLNNYLINQSQYDMWSNLDADELRDKLAAEGILSADKFDSYMQANEGQMEYENPTEEADSYTWNSSTGYSDDGSNNDYSDSDFGGFDS